MESGIYPSQELLDEMPFVDEEHEDGVMMDEEIRPSEMDGRPCDLDMQGRHAFHQKLTVKAKLERALSEELFTDLTCLVGQGQDYPEGVKGHGQEQVKCHSLLLRIHSPTFDQSYTKLQQPSHMTFPNFSPSAFKKFLLFLYTEKFDSSVDETISLIEIATEFQVESLLLRCSKLLKDQIDIPNSSAIYAKATELGRQDLQKFAHNFIIRNAEDVFKTQGFLTLSLPCLRAILASPEKNVDQVSAVNAMIRWGKVRCERTNLDLTPANLHSVLEGCPNLFTFHQFTPAEFSEHVVDTGLLPEREALQILKKLHLTQIGSKSSLKLSHWGMSSQISSGSSSGMSDSASSECSSPTELLLPEQPIRLKRYKNPTLKAWISGGIEKITFMTKQPIRISGVGLYGRSELNAKGEPLPIKASMTLSSFDEIAQVGAARKIFPPSREPLNFDFLFETPVTLQPKTWYSLLVDLGGEVQPVGVWSKKKVKGQISNAEITSTEKQKQSLTIRFKIPKGIGARTRTGQFPQLLFAPNS